MSEERKHTQYINIIGSSETSLEALEGEEMSPSSTASTSLSQIGKADYEKSPSSSVINALETSQFEDDQRFASGETIRAIQPKSSGSGKSSTETSPRHSNMELTDEELGEFEKEPVDRPPTRVRESRSRTGGEVEIGADREVSIDSSMSNLAHTKARGRRGSLSAGAEELNQRLQSTEEYFTKSDSEANIQTSGRSKRSYGSKLDLHKNNRNRSRSLLGYSGSGRYLAVPENTRLAAGNASSFESMDILAGAGLPPQPEHISEGIYIDAIFGPDVRPNNRERNDPFSRYSYTKWFIRTSRQIIHRFMFQPSLFITDPISFITLCIITPIQFVTMLLICGACRLFYRFGGKDLCMEKNGKLGCQLVNWLSPDVFRSEHVKRSILNPGLDALESPCGKTPSFHIDIGQTLLLFSALMYERDDDLVYEAYKTHYRAQPKPSNNQAHPQENKPWHDPEFKKRLRAAQKPISDKANAWNLRFKEVSEMRCLGGPFMGIFFSYERNFIVAAFKGTTPLNVGEWMIDASLHRTDSSTWLALGGQVHEGFYLSLFGHRPNSPQASQWSPYAKLLRNIKAVSNNMRNRKRHFNEPPQLWVTGHSLGGGLASLLYMRLRASPKDLCDHEGHPFAILRDGYTYGSPRVANTLLAQAFKQLTHQPISNIGRLWRVHNEFDVVTCLPLGISHKHACSVDPRSVLAYMHMGEDVPLTTRPDDNDFWFNCDFDSHPDRPWKDFEEVLTEGNKRTDRSVHWLKFFLPKSILSHFPSNYLLMLEMARTRWVRIAIQKEEMDRLRRS